MTRRRSILVQPSARRRRSVGALLFVIRSALIVVAIEGIARRAFAGRAFGLQECGRLERFIFAARLAMVAAAVAARTLLALLAAFAPVAALSAVALLLRTGPVVAAAIIAVAEPAIEAVAAVVLVLALAARMALALAAFAASLAAAFMLTFAARLVGTGQARALTGLGSVEALALRHGAPIRGRRAIGRPGLLPLAEAGGLGFPLVILTVMPLLELVERALIGQDDAIVVVGMLEVVFRHDAITGRRRIAAKRQILLVNLMGRAAQANTGAVAVESLVAALVMVVMMLAWLAMLASAPSAHQLNPL